MPPKDPFLQPKVKRAPLQRKLLDLLLCHIAFLPYSYELPFLSTHLSIVHIDFLSKSNVLLFHSVKKYMNRYFKRWNLPFDRCDCFQPVNKLERWKTSRSLDISVGRGFLDKVFAQHRGCYVSSKTLCNWKMACKMKNIIFYIFYVIFCSFGPYFVDIGHYFVESVKI